MGRIEEVYITAFLSEYSLPKEKEGEEIALKAHLLSNVNLIIPAATISKRKLGEIIYNNVDDLSEEAIKIAHGADVESLSKYPEKYPDLYWDNKIIELYKYFEKAGSVALYKPSETIEKFNETMERCASNEVEEFKNIFLSKDFCREVVIFKEKNGRLFNLGEYIEIIDKHVDDNNEKVRLKAHARYFYNFFGANSTGADTTFSIENMKYYNYIFNGFEKRAQERDEWLLSTGIGIVISAIMDLGISNAKRYGVESFSIEKLKKMNFKDIKEIRSRWIHRTFLKKYDNLAKSCVQAYISGVNKDYEKAIKMLEYAANIREDIKEDIKFSIQTEIEMYNIYKFIQKISSPIIKSALPIPLALEIGKAILTEVVDISIDKEAGRVIHNSKNNKIDAAIYVLEEISDMFGGRLWATVKLINRMKKYYNT